MLYIKLRKAKIKVNLKEKKICIFIQLELLVFEIWACLLVFSCFFSFTFYQLIQNTSLVDFEKILITSKTYGRALTGVQIVPSDLLRFDAIGLALKWSFNEAKDNSTNQLLTARNHDKSSIFFVKGGGRGHTEKIYT